MNNNAKDILLKNKTLSILSFILLLIIFGSVMYGLGFRITNNFSIGKIGQLEMKVDMPGTDIYINQSKKITTTKANEELSINFSPKKHNIIVYRQGYFPWKKDFVIPSGKKINLRPIFVAENPGGQIITTNDSEYWKLRSEIMKNIPPTKDSRITMGPAELWLEDNMIVLNIGSTTINVVQPDSVVRNLSFYKDRTDAVIFSTLNSVYVIDIGEKGNQNFMPIYKGQKPYFIPGSNDFIYVLDGETLMQVVI